MSAPEAGAGGPLAGLRVLELAGLGPAPHAAMVLADPGADVVRVERPSAGWSGLPSGAPDLMLRGRRSIGLDLKSAAGRERLLALVAVADVLIESYRPGVAERLGVGPQECAAVNPRLVYGRMTGWGQDGPMAGRAGHDINYVSLTGLLHAIGRPGERPVPPLNLVGDFGGGSMFLLVGVLAALIERERSGRGQVVDAAMVDGASVLGQMVRALMAAGAWQDRRGANLLDGGCPWYDTYECADGRYVAVGSLEPQFYAELLTGLGIPAETMPARDDPAAWQAVRERLDAALRLRTRDEWAAVFAGTDACVTPVLTLAEAPEHPHLAARGTLVDLHGGVQAAAAPRFSRSRPPVAGPPPAPGQDTDAVLADWLD